MTDEQKKAARELMVFLAAHEADIAIELGDFGHLFNIFVEMFGRRPLDTKVKKNG
jgi:hypothetical protein